MPYNNTLSDHDNYNTMVIRSVLSIGAFFLTLTTITGNLFILIAVRVNQKLRNIHASVLITSLAVADTLVGTLVMPLAVVEVWTGGHWPFGKLMCRLWTSTDVICCTASIVTLCVISVDRYIGLARPFDYSSVVTKRRLWLAVFLVWLFSSVVLVSCVKSDLKNDEPQQQQHRIVDNTNELDYFDSKLAEINGSICNVGTELDYVVHSIVFSFFLPLTVILAFYLLIYRLARKRGDNFVTMDKNVILRRTSSLVLRKESRGNRLNNNNLTKISTPDDNCDSQGHLEKCKSQVNDLVRQLTISQRNVVKKHNKAAFTLALVVGAFVVCWLPFFVLFMISSVCVNCVPLGLLEVFTWLGYSNSALNPFIYALSMKTFGDTLRRIILNRPVRKQTILYQLPSEYSGLTCTNVQV